MTGSVITAIIGLVLTTLSSFTAFHFGRKKEAKGDGESKGVMLSDIGYIKSSVDDIKREQRENMSKIEAISERITRCEESTKQAHRRLDEITAKLS